MNNSIIITVIVAVIDIHILNDIDIDIDININVDNPAVTLQSTVYRHRVQSLNRSVS